ncbi:signal recognition particle-docking protein FtsY [Thermopirellula anaerolimosa]
MGLFDRIKQGLKKTAQILQTDIRDLFKAKGRLVDQAFLDEIFEVLVRTDMGVQASRQIVDRIADKYRNRVIEWEDAVAEIKSQLKELLRQPASPLNLAANGLTVLMVCGVNGCGKTTTIAKLAHMLKGQGKRVVLGAADTFRAAAVQQLRTWAERLGVEIVTGAEGSDPAAVGHRAVAAAIEQAADICIVDTAGRLQTHQNLMRELSKIHRVLGKQVEGAPHEVLLVLDATTGQNGISQAKHFTDAVNCTGLVLAKLDGTAKGGVVVAIRQQVGLPVKFVGVGERPEDLLPFDAEVFVNGLFDE